jgi:hypothetical protein
MSDWIDLSALWRILVAGLLFGAGLPALFGIGLRLLSPPRSAPVAVDNRGASAVTGGPIAVAAAVVCFAVILAAVGWGIYLIVAGT